MSDALETEKEFVPLSELRPLTEFEATAEMIGAVLDRLTDIEPASTEFLAKEACWAALRAAPKEVMFCHVSRKNLP